jgi:predicted amidohydrolase
MQEELYIATIQTNLFWENPEENRKQFQKAITSLNKRPDLIILPEMFTTGFTMHPEHVSEKMNGETINWMLKIAKKTQSAICGSLIIEESNNYYNRFVFVEPNGKIKTYNKRHTFTLAGEHEIYTAGTEKVIIEYKDWKICPMICYDLRFPVWARNLEDYDILIYVANWPEPRVNAWDALLKARAIENMSYCIGVNRIGKDANNHLYVGHTAIYNGLGEALCEVTENDEIKYVGLKKNHIKTIREKFKFLDDKDAFILK